MPAAETRREKEKMKKVAQKAAEAALKNVEEDETPTDPELEVGFTTGEPENNIPATDPTDIFEAGKKIIADGDFPKYTIKKNGEYMTTKPHPYSIELLQKEYGPGSYTVYCKRGSNGQIAKQQTFQIGEVPGAKKPDIEFAFGAPGSPSIDGAMKPSFMEMLTFMKTLNSDTEAKVREATERARDSRKEEAGSAATMMTAMMTMMQQSSQQSQTLFMEMMKSNMNMMKDMNENNNRMFEKLNEKLSTKKEGPDPVQLLRESLRDIRDAETRGYEKATKNWELIEKRAEVRAEELAAQQGDGDESLTKTLIKGFIPLISQAVQNPALPPGQPQPTPEQIAFARQQQEYQRVQYENAQLAQRQQAQRRAEAKKQAQANRPAPATPTVVKPGLTDERPPRETMNGKFKDHIQTLVLPVLAEDYGNRVPAMASAKRCLDLLEAQRITRKDVLDNFKYQDILELIKLYELPKETLPWFEEFYAHLEGKTGNEIGRSAQDSGGPTP